MAITVPSGSIRFNTDSSKLEIYNGEAWFEIDSTSPEQQTGGTRGLMGGGSAPGVTNAIDFINVDTTGNSSDFGDLSYARRGVAALASRTRGVFAGGRSSDNNGIDFVTIASTGDAADFGDLLAGNGYLNGASSQTRSLMLGGTTPSAINVIQFVTISTTGDAVNFGDLATARARGAVFSDSNGGLA